MPAVDQADELNGPRTAEIDQRVEGGADGAAGVQDVVDQHDGLVGDIDGDRRRAQRARGALMHVVAVQRDVQFAQRYLNALEFADTLLEPAGQWQPARPQPDQDHRLNALVALYNLMRQPRHGAPNVVGAKQSLLTQFGH